MALELIAHVRNKEEILWAKEAGYQCVILSHTHLSPLGELSTKNLEALARCAKENNLKTVLLWDILMRDHELDLAIIQLRMMDLNLFDRIRVLDHGALQYLIDESDKEIEVILRNGAHSLLSIQTWISTCDRIKRVVLSSEIPKKRLDSYLPQIKIETEVLGLGPIQLFYTPRFLLTYQTKEDGEREESDTELLMAEASCDENNHKGFRAVESHAGMMLFHEKDYCLVKQSLEISQIGMTAFQVDMRLEKNTKVVFETLNGVAKIIQAQDEAEHAKLGKEFLEAYPTKTTWCFYNANATDALFKKLKNKDVQRVDDNFIGKVIEVVRDEHIIVEVQGSQAKLSQGDSLRVLTPMGKVIQTKVKSLYNLEDQAVSSISRGDYAVLPYLRSVTPASAIYLQ